MTLGWAEVVATRQACSDYRAQISDDQDQDQDILPSGIEGLMAVIDEEIAIVGHCGLPILGTMLSVSKLQMPCCEM